MSDYNPRPKMSKPQRWAYFRVFASVLKDDDDFMFLTTKQWGIIFLLMLNQWVKGGELPDDNRKLAILAKCDPEDIAELREAWPDKLVPIEERPGKCGITFLTKDWQDVTEYCETQKGKSAMGVAARRAKKEGIASFPSPKPNPVDKPGITSGSPDQNPIENKKKKEMDNKNEKEMDNKSGINGQNSNSDSYSIFSSSLSSETSPSPSELTLSFLNTESAEPPSTKEESDFRHPEVGQCPPDKEDEIPWPDPMKAFLNPWEYVVAYWNCWRIFYPELWKIPTKIDDLAYIKSMVDNFCEKNPMWLVMLHAALEHINDNPTTRVKDHFCPSLKKLYQDDGEILVEYAAKYLGLYYIDAPLCYNGKPGWSVATYQGDAPSKTKSVYYNSTDWVIWSNPMQNQESAKAFINAMNNDEFLDDGEWVCPYDYPGFTGLQSHP